MEEDNAFYVVRKGDIIGIYKSLNDCQAQVSSSVSDPAVSVYKGYSLPKETEEILSSRGLKNPLYSMNAADLKDDLFGTLVPCPFQQPGGGAFLVDILPDKISSQKRSTEMANGLVRNGPCLIDVEHSKKPKISYSNGDPSTQVSSYTKACIIEFDGASKGNPGKAGAGAILRAEDGSVISRLRQGLGVVTNNVAEYQALLLGMKYALKKGYKQIRVQGDSNLVCQQVLGIWQCKNVNMTSLCKEAREMKDKFQTFKISHVRREFNSDADAQANLGVCLAAGEVEEECDEQPY